MALLAGFIKSFCLFAYKLQSTPKLTSVYVVSQPKYSTTWKSPLIIFITALHHPQLSWSDALLKTSISSASVKRGTLEALPSCEEDPIVGGGSRTLWL